MKGIRNIRSSKKYSGEISLRLDEFILDGRHIEKEIVEHRNSVGILAIDGGIVILVSQYRRAADAVLLEIPAGKLEQGETPLQAARRELVEEIGYKPKSLKPLVRCYLAPGYDTEYMTIFIARRLIKVQRGELDEDENIQ